MADEMIDFEKELQRLNEIVKKVQSESTSLDESVKLYEEGNKIIAKLEKALKDSEDKVEKIIESNKK